MVALTTESRLLALSTPNQYYACINYYIDGQNIKN
jgi:hypothetical protein